MDVRAIIVLGPAHESMDHPLETLSVKPLALTDVLGKPVVFRVIERLRAHGIRSLAVVTDVSSKDWPVGAAAQGTWIPASRDSLWRLVQQTFTDFSQGGAETILLVRIGPYTEVNYSDLTSFHRDNRRRLTCVVDEAGTPVDIYAIDASRRNDAAYLFRHQLRKFRADCDIYTFDGYSNRLATPLDLRNLAIDGLMERNRVTPEGDQIRPGVWVARGATIHRRARILSPAYIGAGARVRAAAVVTRCSALEHHSVVDCGTVVENVTTLPYTYVGAGLDVTHSIVGDHRVWNLKRDVEVEFADSSLIGRATANAPLRALGSLLSLSSFLPAQFLRGIFAPSHRDDCPSLPDAIQAPSPALDRPANPVKSSAPSVDAGEFPANLAIARRYGNE
jgi:hypothetical protein